MPSSSSVLVLSGSSLPVGVEAGEEVEALGGRGDSSLAVKVVGDVHAATGRIAAPPLGRLACMHQRIII